MPDDDNDMLLLLPPPPLMLSRNKVATGLSAKGRVPFSIVNSLMDDRVIG